MTTEENVYKWESKHVHVGQSLTPFVVEMQNLSNVLVSFEVGNITKNGQFDVDFYDST